MRTLFPSVAVLLSLLTGSAASVAASGESLAQTLDRSATDLAEAQRLFYNGHYEAAAMLTLPLCVDDDQDALLDACELRSSALLFQIKRKLPKGMKKQDAYKACTACPPLMTAFQAVTRTGQSAARTGLKRAPLDESTRFLLGKIDLNYVWLHLGLLGRKTGWGEYWEGRRAMDAVLETNPGHMRAQVSRAWIDYIVDTQAPRGTRWLLGGGNKKRGLRVVEDAAGVSGEPFVRAEAGFALWDMRVREGNVAGAVVIARELLRDFPENEELNRFLADQDAVALR